MDSKHSRIPKFSFGLKKPNSKSSPSASPGASPVSRSKSMKVQRTTTPLVQRRPKHSNSIDNDQDLDESQTDLLQTPTSSHMPKSQPGSRSTTPTATPPGVTMGGLTRSMTVSSSRNKDTPTNIRSPLDTNGVKGHTRSSSFSSRERHNVIPTPNTRQAVHSHIPDKLRSGKGLTQSMESPRQQLKRTTSNPRTSQDESDGSAEPPRHGILRNSDSRRSSIGSQNGGRRPNSMISFSEKSSDLNELASEITEMGDPHVFGSTPPRIPSSTRTSSGSRTGEY